MQSQPPSLENPFVGIKVVTPRPFMRQSQPPSLENPFVGEVSDMDTVAYGPSQPPSLENPFVGYPYHMLLISEQLVSTSKPRESLCG